MKPFPLSFSALAAAALLALPALARADVRPDFEEDAKPILKSQPQLLHYVHENFDVKETGYSKLPGDDDHRPAPPYIFRARHHGASGPYNITLLIQPGPPGHILFVKPDAPGTSPGAPMAGQPPMPPPGPGPQPQQNAPTANTPPPGLEPANNSQAAPPTTPPAGGPTADTPSGPIKLDAGSNANGTPTLAPPPDPAPTH